MKIVNAKKPLTLKEVEEVELRLGIRLPADYREFLLQHNGGWPTPNAFTFYDTDDQLSNSLITYFHAVCDPDDENFSFEDLENVSDFYLSSNRMPPNILPIASDPFGNYVCISVYGHDTGKVYFWDHDLEPQDGSYENLSIISGSFNEFIENLKELEE